MLKKFDIAKCVGISFVISIVLEIFLIGYNNIENLQGTVLSFSTLSNLLVSDFSFLTFIFLFAVFFVVSGILFLYGNVIGPFIYRYRYFFALAVIAFCVIFEISGSSIAQWVNILPGGDNVDSGMLFGVSRPIRSDEYALNTPMAFSQYYNQTGPFQYYGDTMRGASTDMFVVYGQPVYNLMMIFRPFQLGYLFLEPAKGLAFFWSARLVALFMVSFEFGMLITNRSKSWSLSLAVLTAFSSGVQWWFSVNGLVEILVFGELAILILHHYLKTSRYLYRFLLTLALVVCGGAYILVFYPAWQVPLAYFFLALVIWVFWEGKSRLSSLGKKDIGLLVLFIVLLASAMVYLFMRSGDTINAVSSTAYPGQRVEIGGGALLNLFFYPASFFYPFTDVNMGLNLNVVEAAAFLSFFPLGILLSFWVIFKEKNRDRLLILLLAVILLLGVYCITPLPEWIAKLTLLGNSTPNRARFIFDFVNMILLIRAASISKTHWKSRFIIPFSIIYALFVVWLSNMSMPEYMTKTMIALSVAILFVGVALLFYSINSKAKNAYMFVLFSICVSLFAGFSVNPIQQGIDVIYENELTKDIYQVTIDDDDEGLWLVEGVSYPMINLPVMVGASTINSTNVYPNLERWKKLDPTGQYEEIYNRYAHISVDIQTDSPTNFQLIQADVFKVNLNVNDLKTLGVEYILSPNDLEQHNDENQTFNLIEQDGDYKIYQVVYSEDV